MQLRNWRHWGVGGALVGALALGSCSHEQTWTMDTTNAVPAAEGKVKVKSEKDGNTRVKVEVAHLAQPETAFNATTYVVWLKPQMGPVQNVGVLGVGKDLKGTLETKTAFKDFRVIVTAEDFANVTMPTGKQVMNTRVVMPT